jgi:hypothetical protein
MRYYVHRATRRRHRAPRTQRWRCTNTLCCGCDRDTTRRIRTNDRCFKQTAEADQFRLPRRCILQCVLHDRDCVRHHCANEQRFRLCEIGLPATSDRESHRHTARSDAPTTTPKLTTTTRLGATSTGRSAIATTTTRRQ